MGNLENRERRRGTRECEGTDRSLGSRQGKGEDNTEPEDSESTITSPKGPERNERESPG